jgi:hypothetical protein
MLGLDLLEYYKSMVERDIVLDFQGAISQDMLVGMGEVIKKKCSQEVGSAAVVKKIFAIFIEMAQNIALYSAERSRLSDGSTEVGAGIIVVTENNKCYTIISGNLVEKDAITGIINHCQKINHMDKEELKQFYKEQINLSREKGKKGGGIGLIAVVRKSGNPISYKVTPVDDQHSFLVLSVKIEANPLS